MAFRIVGVKTNYSTKEIGGFFWGGGLKRGGAHAPVAPPWLRSWSFFYVFDSVLSDILILHWFIIKIWLCINIKFVDKTIFSLSPEKHPKIHMKSIRANITFLIVITSFKWKILIINIIKFWCGVPPLVVLCNQLYNEDTFQVLS